MKSVLIDIDGTICDGQERKYAAFRECVGLLNRRFHHHLKSPITMDVFWGITRAQFSVYTGSKKNDLNTRFRMLLSLAGMDEKEIEDILPELDKIYWQNLSKTSFYPGANDVISCIKEQGFDVYYFTDSSVREAVFKLSLFPDELSPRTSKIIVTSSGNSMETRPDKQIISIGQEKTGKAYQYLKENYGAVAMIGDSPEFDIIPAKKAGLAAFEVRDGNIEGILDGLISFLKQISRGSTDSSSMSLSSKEGLLKGEFTIISITEEERLGLDRKNGARHHRAFVGPSKHYDLASAMQFNLLTFLGLREHHYLLDIGCGSLRAGKLFIPYLLPGHYYGIEPEEWLIEKGIELELGKDIIRIKKPVISNERNFTFTTFKKKFDYFLAQSIFTHASQKQIRRCLSEVRKTMKPISLVAATFSEGEESYTGKD
ncbi:MAG: HAD family hydrolase [Thermoplasmata archaeon]|nr:HAD family hydrolase [Thermoplasmata archaeon]